MTDISVFGLGYVGTVTAACLARQGHAIVGVDVHAQKVADFNRGASPILEPGVPELLAAAKSRKLLRATLDAEEAVLSTDVSLVCVGTPSGANGTLDLAFVDQVTGQIGDALRQTTRHHTLVLRSTILPGSTEELVRAHLADLEDEGRLEIYY